MYTIGVFATARSLRNILRIDSELRSQCNVTYLPYTSLEHLCYLFEQNADRFDGYLFGGLYPYRTVQHKFGPLHKPHAYFTMSDRDYYQVIARMLVQNPTLDFRRVYFDRPEIPVDFRSVFGREDAPLLGSAPIDWQQVDDYIGGRYSSTSAVGGAVLSLAFGPEVFAAFLEGAAAEDKLSANKDVLQNPEMLDALIGVYERNVLGYPSTAILPYSQALNRFPAHLQQVDMESNGKSVNRFGEPVDYPTGPVLFGEPGTNGQHSFYQLLHQGTDIVPLQFVGFRSNQMDTDVDIQGSTSQQKLCANVAAQIVAFACGKEDENKNKNFEGGRPSSIIIGEQVNPKTLGALLAHFENKIMFQGFLWNVNSFDQEGVQLGKVLAKRVLAHETDGALKVFSDLLNI